MVVQLLDPARDAAVTIISRAQADGAVPVVESLFDPVTANVTHVVHDPGTRAAMIVDPVLDLDVASGRTSTRGIDAVLSHVAAHDLRVEWILDTHIHADHLSAATALRDRVGGRVGMSRHVGAVLDRFGDLFDMDGPDGSTFDRLFDDGDTFMLGGISCTALHVPGHTPADMAFVVGDVVLTGDTLFMPDLGTARADFSGGDAAQLYRSTRRLLSLPLETRLLHCHDYPPPGRTRPAWRSTVAEQRAGNVHVRDGIDEADFVAMRTARDATLPTPALMLAAVQVNLNGGRLPAPASNGRRYLKLPLNSL